MRINPLRFLLGLLVATTLVAVATTALRSRPSTPRNVVLILIDTLRADHLGAYGYERPTSPFIDQLAAKSILFENAVSAASATFPSVNSLLTSQPPSVFYSTNAADLGIPEEMTTLAEVFAANGFRTGAVSASPLVRRSPSKWNPLGGFGQGFERFDESCYGVSAGSRAVPPYTSMCVAKRARRMLESFDGSPFFLYIHYLDPHDPYQPPASFDRFNEPYKVKPFIAWGMTYPIIRWLYEHQSDPQLDSADIQYLMGLYDGEILGVDTSLRWLFKGFAKAGRLDDTLFVLLSDHGESFMEHNHIQHGHSLYQTELHIPLIFHWSQGWHNGLRRHDLVCTIDVMPTILELMHLPVPKDARGMALFNASTAEHACLSEGREDWHAGCGNLVSLRLGSDKIIYDRESESYEAYDVAADPQEMRNIAPRGGAIASARLTELRRVLDLWAHAPVGQPAQGRRHVILSPDAERALRTLGYIE